MTWFGTQRTLGSGHIERLGSGHSKRLGSEPRCSARVGTEVLCGAIRYYAPLSQRSSIRAHVSGNKSFVVSGKKSFVASGNKSFDVSRTKSFVLFPKQAIHEPTTE